MLCLFWSSALGQVVFGRLTDLAAFTGDPELVEEYFYLIARGLEYCPGPLLASPLLTNVVQCGVVGLQV